MAYSSFPPAMAPSSTNPHSDHPTRPGKRLPLHRHSLYCRALNLLHRQIRLTLRSSSPSSPITAIRTELHPRHLSSDIASMTRARPSSLPIAAASRRLDPRLHQSSRLNQTMAEHRSSTTNQTCSSSICFTDGVQPPQTAQVFAELFVAYPSYRSDPSDDTGQRCHASRLSTFSSVIFDGLVSSRIVAGQRCHDSSSSSPSLSSTKLLCFGYETVKTKFDTARIAGDSWIDEQCYGLDRRNCR